MDLPRPGLGVTLALLTAFLWGTMPIAGKLALRELGPLDVTVWRVVGGALGLAAILSWEGQEILASLKRHPWLTTAATVGLLGNYFLYMAGLSLTTPTAAQVVIQLSSVFLFAWGLLFFGEHATATKVGGIALATTGALIVTWNGSAWAALLGSKALLGNALIAGAALSFSVYAALQKRLEAHVPSTVVLGGVLLLGAVPATPYAVASLDVVFLAGMLSTVALAYLLLTTVAAYASFAKSLKRLDATRVAVIVTFAPVVTLALDALAAWLAPGLLNGDGITRWTVLGTALVVVGVVLVSHDGGDERERERRDVSAD